MLISLPILLACIIDSLVFCDDTWSALGQTNIFEPILSCNFAVYYDIIRPIYMICLHVKHSMFLLIFMDANNLVLLNHLLYTQVVTRIDLEF